MSTIDLIGEILSMTAGSNWYVSCIPFGWCEENICISTVEPLHSDVKDVIKRIFYERTPAYIRVYLTFARKKKP